MGITPAEADSLDLWEYEALLVHWNRSQGGGDDEISPPDAKRTQALLEAINSDPRLTGQKVPA